MGLFPQGANWHQVLLEQMTVEIPHVRPAVISDQVRERLDEYRGFRHVVRNVYTVSFDPMKIRKLIEEAPAMFSQVRAELLAFAEFLEQLARAGEGG